MAKSKPTLSKALQGKFEMVGFLPGEFRKGNDFFDTTKMSVTEANRAIKLGVTFIRKIEKIASKKDDKS